MTTQIPENDGCVWPIDPACFNDDWEGLGEELKARSLALASNTLRRLTGYRVGGCPVKLRPCSRVGCAAYGFTYGLGPFAPLNWGGVWVNTCGCSDLCGCAVAAEIVLPGPVGRIDEVRVDGAVVDPSEYRLDSGNRLVRLGGETWPARQDLSLPDTEENTFSITYLNSYPVDGQGAYAAAVLAMEFSKACRGKNCSLPKGVTSITRQGVTMDIVSGAFPDGLTGITEVDTYVALWNPNRLQTRARIWSPTNQPRFTP